MRYAAQKFVGTQVCQIYAPSKARKLFKKLGRVVFACEADARKAADRWLLENPHFILQNLKINAFCKCKGSKIGRPKKDEELEKGYRVEAEVERNEENITNERARLGRFILASN
jgi:transposase